MQLSDFLKITSKTKMRQRTIDAARLVLVDGMRIVDAAAQMEMKPQQLQEAVTRVEAAFKASLGTPEDWECITVSVPPKYVEQVREIARIARREAGLTVD